MKRSFSVVLLLCSLLVFLGGCDDGGGNAPAASVSTPMRLSAVDSSTLVVTDYAENQCCTIDKSSLKVIRCFKTKGKPSGVVYADYNGGRFFIGNQSVGSVDMFNGKGEFIGHFGGKTNLFGMVNDLAIDEDSQTVFVLDSKAPIVKIFDYDGVDQGFDFGGSDLVRPTALAFIPSTGEILVSDFGDPNSIFDPCPQIRVFNSDLTHNPGLAILGTQGGGGMLGSCDGIAPFSAPQGMFVDSSNNVFLVDALSGTVNIFDFEASRSVPLESDVPAKVIGSFGFGSEELFYPLDVTVDESTKDVFVADHRNGRITVFEGGGVLP